MNIEIEKFFSPNYLSRNGDIPDLIVLHQSFRPAESRKKRYLLEESNDSVHFYITLKGEIWQFVPIIFSSGKDVCSEIDPLSKDHWSRSLSKIIREREKDPSSYIVSVEFEGIGSGYLSRAQFEAGIKTIKYIKQQLKELYEIDIPINREHMIGGYKLSPTLFPFEPGLDFPFIKLMEECGDGHRFFEMSI